MTYNELWAQALSYALNHHMPNHRANQFAHEYARALEELAANSDVLSPEQFDRLVRVDDNTTTDDSPHGLRVFRHPPKVRGGP